MVQGERQQEALSGRLRAHIRTNVVAYVALFLVLTGGVAWGTHPGGANTISTGDIINDEVRSVDIRDDAVHNEDIGGDAITSNKVADETLTSADVALNTLTKLDLATNSVGPLELDGNAFRSEDIKAQFSGFSKKYGIPPNAIQSDEIENGTIQRVDLADEAQGPHVFELDDPASSAICNQVFCSEGTLSLPPGFYVIFGKIQLDQFDSLEEDLNVRCQLRDSGGAIDQAFTRVIGDTGFGTISAGQVQSMQGVLLLVDRGAVSINCKDFATGDARALDLKIDAIKLGSINVST